MYACIRKVPKQLRKKNPTVSVEQEMLKQLT